MTAAGLPLAGAPAPVRLVHLSDIHVTAQPLGWTRGDWFTKRLSGWLNVRWLGRRRHFRHTEVVLSALKAELQTVAPDRIVFSGDATALGFESELARAAALLGLRGPQALPGLAVPGNHDYYTRAAAASGLFECYFAPWQEGTRIDGATYPFAQRVGHLWLIGVNSCTGNRWPWDAAGGIDPGHLARLRTLLSQLPPGPRILVTHYPVCLASGRPERHLHGLRNLGDLVRVAAAGGVSLWLHGHRHGDYHLADPCLAPFPVVCAGSATQRGLWGYNRCTIDGLRFRVQRRLFDSGTRAFRDAGAFEVSLRDPLATLTPQARR